MTAIGVLAAFVTVFYRGVLLVPGFDRTLYATRFIFFVDFGLAGLAALGLQSLLETRGRFSRALAMRSVLAPVAALVGVLVLLTLAPVWTAAPDSYVRRGGAKAIAIALVGGLLLAGVVRFRSRAEPIAVGLGRARGARPLAVRLSPQPLP